MTSPHVGMDIRAMLRQGGGGGTMLADSLTKNTAPAFNPSAGVRRSRPNSRPMDISFEAGVEHEHFEDPEMPHGYVQMEFLPPARSAVDRMIDFLRRTL